MQNHMKHVKVSKSVVISLAVAVATVGVVSYYLYKNYNKQ